MKKIFAIIVSLLILTAGLTACQNQTADGGADNQQTVPQDSSSAAGQESDLSETSQPEEATGEAAVQTEQTQIEPEKTEEPVAEETEDEAPGVLIAYFSWSGNTEQFAQMIQSETGGDLFEISPATPYTDDYDELLDIARDEQSDNARPELASQVENWDDYDVVFVGYPDWWSDAPMLIYSFLESYDWQGKTLVPFCTSGGSGFGRSLDKLPDSAQGAAILEGLHVSGSRVDEASEDIADWISGLNIGLAE